MLLVQTMIFKKLLCQNTKSSWHTLSLFLESVLGAQPGFWAWKWKIFVTSFWWRV